MTSGLWPSQPGRCGRPHAQLEPDTVAGATIILILLIFIYFIHIRMFFVRIMICIFHIQSQRGTLLPGERPDQGGGGVEGGT